MFVGRDPAEVVEVEGLDKRVAALGAELAADENDLPAAEQGANLGDFGGPRFIRRRILGNVPCGQVLVDGQERRGPFRRSGSCPERGR